MYGAFTISVQPTDPSVLRIPTPWAPMRVVADPCVGQGMVLVSVDRSLVVRTSKVLGFLRSADRIVLRTENSMYTLTRVSEGPTFGTAA